MLYNLEKKESVISVDFDDVVSTFNQSFVAFHNREFGTKIQFSDIQNYQLGLTYSVDETTIIKRIMHFCHHYHDELGLIEGAKEGLLLLGKTHELHIVTSRKEVLRDITEDWIERHLPGVFSGIHFTGSFGAQTISYKNAKSTVCLSLNTSILIEDALHHATDASANGVTTLLLDNPWNQAPLPEGVIRVEDWRAITKYITTVTT